jgi:isocitrate dehydrogenase (NAD+)
VSHRVTLIRGDGIGPEVVDAATRAIEATGVEIDWDRQVLGAAAVATTGDPLPAGTVASIAANGVALKGPVATPRGGQFRSPNIALRAELGLYAGVRPCRFFEGLPHPLGEVDVVVLRMTDDDLYSGIELEVGSAGARELAKVVDEATSKTIPADAGVSIKAISRSRSARAAEAAFEYATRHGRRKVTAVQKATVMRFTDGLFLEATREVATRFGDIEYEERLVDSVCHDLVTRPDTLDVLFTSMLYGDILSDLCAGLVGGLGVAPGLSLGQDCAVFEAAHGTAERLAGRDRANPMALILSGALLLRHLGEDESASRLESAVASVIRTGRTVTYDLRPDRSESAAAGTAEVAEAVVAELA